MDGQRRGLWAENALGLGGLTLVSILLNAALVWLYIEQVEFGRRRDLALSLSDALSAQLEVELGRGAAPGARFRQVMGAYQATTLPVEEAYVADADLRTLASIKGRTEGWDEGWAAALSRGEQHVDRAGPPLRPLAVVVTSPIGGGDGREPVAALRVRVALGDSPLFGGGAGFVLVYTLTCTGIVALLGWALFRRNLIRPLQQISEGTRRIADGEFGTQLSVEASRELEELCAALNAMSSSLAGYRARTADQLVRLETAYDDLAAAQNALVRSEKLAVVGRLAAGLAHEIGNPLAAVLGYMELLSEGLSDPQLRDPALERDLVERARLELERIHRTIRQLLDFARPGDGISEDVSVQTAVSDALDTVRPQPALRGILIRAEVPEALNVRIERDKLHQLLVNLLLNAADAVGGAGQVWLRAKAESRDGIDGVGLRCEDDGPGFTEEALARAFEPFFTTKPAGQGTGLGLATCLSVVEAAGGQIALGNREEGGAWLDLWLPRGGP